VWFDAPIGYISITANYTAQWERWWKPNSDTIANTNAKEKEEKVKKVEVELSQFMGKDNIPFHSVIFPSTLLAADNGFTVVKNMSVTEYLNYEDGKFSKSRGVGVFGDSAQASGIPCSVWRYYLLANRPETSDSTFTWNDFQSKCNNELNNNLGNYVNRAFSFCSAKFGGSLPDSDELQLELPDIALLTDLKRGLFEYVDLQEKFKIKDALRMVMQLSKRANQYIQELAPWVLFKDPETRGRCHTVVAIAVNVAVFLAVLLEPFVPAVSRQICKQGSVDFQAICALPSAAEAKEAAAANNGNGAELILRLPPRHKIGKRVDIKPLFSNIDDEQLAQLKARYSGQQ
jgi:methionyl-tRNA synthetase